jgi:hypothetical protein
MQHSRLAAVGSVIALVVAACGPTTSPGPSAAASAALVSPTASMGSTPEVSTTPTPTPTPTPAPSQASVDPLDGLPVSADLAARPVIAVMIDDSPAARPQSGLAAASVVIQAPAEGGIPRYLVLFHEGTASSIGPIRSARLYYVAWAAEWRALYAHVNGSDEANAHLPTIDRRLLFDADSFRFGQPYMLRITQRVAPHNVYATSASLLALAAKLGVAAPGTPHWTFMEPVDLAARPTGGSIVVPYPANFVRYDYDRTSNTYLRSSGGSPETDAAGGARIAPTNVVVLYMSTSRPLGANGPEEIDVLSGGKALVAHDGRVVRAWWTKASEGAPTLFWQVDASGRPTQTPAALTPGQVFVQVVPIGTTVTVTPGR